MRSACLIQGELQVFSDWQRPIIHNEILKHMAFISLPRQLITYLVLNSNLANYLSVSISIVH